MATKEKCCEHHWRKFIHTVDEEIPQEPSLQSTEADRIKPQIPLVPASQCAVADRAEADYQTPEAHKNLILKVSQQQEHVWTRQRQLMKEIQRVMISKSSGIIMSRYIIKISVWL